MIVGRADELAQLERLLGELRDGRGSTLVLRGEAGIGKTALLRALGERCDGEVTLLRAGGVEAEAELAFSACPTCWPRFTRSLPRCPAPRPRRSVPPSRSRRR